MKVYLDVLPWDVRSRNTDWRHARYALPQIAEFEPDIEFHVQQSRRVTLAGNAKAFLAAGMRRLKITPPASMLATSRLDAGELAASGAELVVSHASYPLNAGEVPVHWIHAIVDPEMQRSYGIPAEAIAHEIETKLPLFEKAASIQVYTESELARHRRDFPHIADRFVTAPYFTPHARAASPEILEKHLEPEVRILFVGNQAKRKGLPELVAGFMALPAAVQSRARLLIISNFDHSSNNLPAHPRIDVIPGASSARVMEEMRRAHIFVNVAHFESYGLVFTEAMSQGVACIGPDWEVQRELLDFGRAGINVKTDADQIRLALEELIEDDQRRGELARAGYQRFQSRYAPAVVAAKYAAIFRATPTL